MPAPMGASSRTCSSTAEALDPDGTRRVLTPPELGLAYRHCGVPEDWIFIAARFAGEPGDRDAIGRRMAEIQAARAATQPIRARTGGSTFANPPGHKAWELIDAAGCRGLRRGGAMVSEQHANFLINTGTATAAEIEALGEEVRRRVREQSGITLEWEIRRIGDAGAGAMTRVAVLMGGWSAEREVSLVSGTECARALARIGYEVSAST